jgi:hypothetical protein
MDLDPTTRHELEQKLSTFGALLKRDNRPAATDDQLWEHCWRLSRGELGKVVDPALLAVFRVAFDHGYQPALVDLAATVLRLRSLGFFAETVARDHRRELVAGKWPHYGSDDDPWPVTAGPGWVTGTSVFAHTDLLTVGRTDTITAAPVGSGTTPWQLADAVIALIEKEPDRWRGDTRPTRVTDVPFAASQAAPGGGALSLIHDGVQWADVFRRQVANLVDNRIAELSPAFGQAATVFSGMPGDPFVTQADGLLIHRHAGLLVFSDGFTMDGDFILSIHLPGDDTSGRS